MCTRKRKNGVDAVEETVFKKTSKHPYTTDGFYTACKVGCCGGRGAEETWNPSVVENVSSTCVQHRRSSWLLILRFQSFRRNMKFSKEKLYHCFFTAMLSRMCFLWFCFSLAELLNVAPAWDLQFSSPGDAFRDPIAQRLLWEANGVLCVAANDSRAVAWLF